MKKKFIILLFLLLFIHSIDSECPVLCDTCPVGSSTCSACYPGFQDTLYSQWTPAGTCPCPAGYFMNTTSNLCLFCPITCETCINMTTCTSCIAGYQLDNNNQCTKKYSNPGQWVTIDVGNDLTQQKLQKSVTTGFFIIDYVASMLVSNSIQNCTKLSPQLFFGMYSFDYNTQVIKSYFGLPHHDWVHIKFQFVAINNWTNTKMILEINDRQSYKLDLIEGVLYSTSKQYSFNIRHRDFCLSGTPDNLGFFNLYLSHQASMLKIRIRTDLMNTSSTNGNSFSDYVYFGLSNLFVRSGTCPTNCRRCSGPNVCLQCISPYKTTQTNTCECNTTIGQLTQLGRCVPKCQTGYIFTKIQSMSESKCILCSLVNDNLRNCFACSFAYNSYQCLICQQGFVLNSTTGKCSQYCPSNSYIKVTFDSNYGVNRMQCVTCGVNCLKCSYGVCSICANGTVYQQGNCVSTCSDGFYLNSVTNQCLKCLQNCANCTDQFTCTRCSDTVNFVITGGQCIPKCIKYNNCSTTNCNATCSQCYGTSSNQCTSCSSITNFLQSNTCVNNCSQGYFLLNTNQCAKCLSPCLTCVNYQSCSSCQNGYFLHSQSCIRSCPINYYADNLSICKACSINCKSCYNDTSCIECANNYILFEGGCILDTPCSRRVGFYYDEQTFQCLPCPQNCTSCYKDLCYRCSLATVLDNGKCIEQCTSQKVWQQQFYFDPISQTNQTMRVCRWKDPLCNHYTLMNGSSVCDQCIFMNPMLVLLSPSNQCSFTCPLDMVKVQSDNIVSCQACPANCNQCTSNLTCIKCNTNFVLNPMIININTTVQCLSTCPQGYTSDGYQCFPCKVNCKSCDIMGRCYQCYSPYLMTLSNNCVTDTSCLSNQYKNSSICVNCSTGCLTCLNSTVCTACGVSSIGIQYYLKQSTCVIDCSSGYFKYPFGNQCRKCPTQCLTCVSSTQCSICIQGYFLLLHPIQRVPNTQIGTCVRECPLGYYNNNPLNTDKQIATCLFCSSNCLSCYGSSQDQCLSCYGTFKLANGRCVENCPAGKYEDTTGHCDWCHPSCLSCTGPAQFQCITCNPGYYLYRSQCYQYSCPGSTYPVDYDSRVCQLCQWGCQVCSSPYNCSVCTGGFYLYQGWCYLQCPLNTQPYLDIVNQGYRCGKCSSKWYNCVQCVSSNCTRCAPSYYKLKNDCLTSCPVGYYADLTPFPMCKNCPRNCFSCASQTKCTQCSSGYILYNGQCSTTCPSTKYFNRLNYTCSNCKQNCLNCISEIQCQTCINGYYLYKQYMNGTLTSYCLVDCGDYRYEDQQTNTCQNCSSNCKTCTAMNNCTRCLSGYTLLNGYCYPTNNTNPTCNILHCLKCLNPQLCETCQSPYYLLLTATSLTLTSSCVDKCPVGTFADGKNCKICNLTCTACFNGPNNCSQCVAGFYLFERRCWKQCPIGFYKNDTLSQCIRCPSDCYDCLNLTYCKSCQLQRKSYKGSCYDSCPDSTYDQGQICIDCPSTCKKCDSLNSCTQCQASYVLFESQCILDCPSGTYLSLTELTCKKCLYPCNFCKGQGECTTCVEGFVFDSQIDKCVTDCGDGKFAKNASINGYQCSTCAQNCNKCLNSTYCLTCTNNRFMWKGKCLSNCPIGTFADIATQRCKSCSPNCLACVVYEACIQCHNQTVLYNGKCLEFCPAGTFKIAEYSYETRTSTNLCKPCLSPCNECNGSTVYNCKSCVANFYLYESICVNSCPAGTYAAAIETFSTPTLQVNLIKNGQFELNKCQYDYCMYNSSYYVNEVDGWMPHDTLEIGYGRLYSKYLTTQRVVQLGQRNSCVKQYIPSLIAGDYQLQFSYAARKNRQFSDCQFKVQFNGIQVSYIYPSDYLVHTQTVNVTLTANSTNVELQFCAYAGSNSNYGSIIKGISLVKKTTQMTTFSTTIVNSLQARCVECPVGCVTCTNKTYCTECVVNWTLGANNLCKPNSQCNLQNCEICQFTTLSICRKCIQPYNLIRNNLLPSGTNTSTNTSFSCVLSCPMNTFQAENYTCLSCPTNCAYCKYTQCTACKAGFFLFKASCVETCPVGFTANIVLGTCVPVTCLYRNSNGDCIQCVSPYLLQRGTCVTVCGQRTFQQDNICVDCDSVQSHCYNCTSLTSCTSCITGYFYFNGACINKCPSTQYLTTINTSSLQSCTPCSNTLEGCLYCTNSTTCIQCMSPYLLVQNRCVLNCPTTFYKSPYKQQCISCSSMITNCLQCFNQTTCISCVNGTYLVNGKCMSQCPNGYYLNSSSNECQSCDSKCFSCTSLGNCISCRQGYFIIASTMNNITTYSCTQACPIGFYASINSACVPCSSECLTCTFEKCLSCPTGKYLMQGKCLTICPDHYFALNGQCKICSSLCKTCVDGESKCTSCYDGFVYNATTLSCITNCTLPNQFYDSLTYSCANCSVQCQTCYGPRYDQCLTCNNPLSLSNGICISQCPSGFYRDSNSICRQCDLTKCLTCQGSASNCTSCGYPNVLIVSLTFNGRCEVNCGSGYYYDSINKICVPCSTGCVSCIDSLSCISCENSKYLYQDKCITTCPTGYVASIIDNTCKKCPINCNTCTIDVNTQLISCTQCITPLYLINGTCYTTCPSNAYLSTNQCVPCQNNCLTCKDSTTCITCVYPYVFYQNQCFTICPTGYVNVNSVCVPSQYCTQFVYNGSCYSQCPVSTYLIPNTTQCKDCAAGCLQCYSSDMCTSCITGFYLYINPSQAVSCEQQCPLTSYPNGKYCVDCPSSCNQCIIINGNVQCTSCLTGYYYNGNCVSSCPSGYYVQSSTLSCQKCNSQCLTCTQSGCVTCSNSLYSPPNCQSSNITCLSNQYVEPSNSSCVNCNPACLLCYGPSAAQCTGCTNSSGVIYYLLGSACLSDCPVGYVKDNTLNKCTSCSVTNCLNCTQSPTSCTTCLSGYILFTNSTTTKCILNCNELNLPSTNYILSPTTSTCISCSNQVSNCLDCYYSTLSSKTICTTCTSSYFLYPNNTCLAVCPSAGFYLYQNKYCLPCGLNCVTCSSDSICTVCNSNYNLYQNQCVSTCPLGYYSNTGVCTVCETNCKTCNSSQCIQCNKPYTLDATNHCTQCIAGYFMNSVTSICQQCATNCLQCSVSSTQCTKCASPLFLFNNICLATCPSGYYGNIVQLIQTCSTCQNIVMNCATCVSSGCTKCKDTFYLYAATNMTTYQCVSQCPVGYYADSVNMICLKCMLPYCAQCSSSSQCTLCTSPYKLFASSCIQQCPLGYTSTTNTSNLSCQPCKSGCKDCSLSINNCTVCNDNFQNNNDGSCSPIPNTCLTGEYLNAMGTCSPCHTSCLTCYGGSRINCLTCRVPQFVLQADSSCQAICSNGFYYDSLTTQCQSCSTKYGVNCLTCDSSQCYSCSTGVLSSDGQSCSVSCTGSTYLYNGICLNCPQYCLTCTSSTTCTQCINSTYILYNNLCYSNCPLTTQLYNNTCRSCDNKCLVCVGTITNCTSCKSIYKLYGNTCVDVCPLGTYQGNVVGVNNVVCLDCLSPCVACSVTGTNCTLCPISLYLYNYQCVASCPAQTFINSTTRTCEKCQYPCLNCISSSINCTTCQPGYVYSSNGNTCSSQCPDGFYLNVDAMTNVTSCLTCSLTNCKTCDASQCYKCSTGYYATLSASNVITSCTNTCPDYYFIQATTSTCQKCKNLCLTCTSVNDCQKCVTPYFLYNNQCLTSCPQQTYSVLNAGGYQCRNCGTNCKVCVDNVTCTNCVQGSYLLNAKCYQTCPSGYYGRSVDYTCQPCSLSNCSICTALQCQQCALPYFGMVDSNTNKIMSCVPTCPDYYFANPSTQLCERCFSGCKQCFNNSTCQQCQSPKILFINNSIYSCLDQCPLTYYYNNVSSTCELCGLNCNQCNTSTTCYNCTDNFVVFYNSSAQTTCIPQCPQYYYKTLTTQGYAYCEACSANCLQCTSSNQCTLCQSTHTLVNYICVPHNCVNCDYCDRSVNPPICLNCTLPFLLYKIKCFNICPVYYFPTVNQTNLVLYCQKCIDNCINCSSRSTCNLCIPDYVYVEGSGCVNEAVYQYGAAANMSGFTSNITQTMAKVYLGTSVGPVAFGQMSTTYFNVEFTQMMLFHPSGGNSQMNQFLNSLQSMSLTSGGTTVTDTTAPQEVQARRRLLTTATYYTQSFIQVNASIFFLMFAFLGAYLAIYIFQRFITQTCRVSCNLVWFYLDAICEFMQKRFKWIYFDFIMWLSYIPFLYFAVLQLKEFSFDNGSQGFSSILAAIIICSYPLYPLFICHLLKSHYTEISLQPGEKVKQTLTEMSLSPFLTKVKRPVKNIVVPWQEQAFSCRKYFNKANFILIYYPLKYIRKFLFVMVAAIVTQPVNMVAILIAINVLFIMYIIALRPREMPYLIFDLIIEFVLLAFEGFLLVYLILDGPKIAMMSIITHAVGFITANLSLITAIVLNLIAYYKIFLCIKDLISHLRQKAAERTQAYNKFQVEKQFLDPNSDLYIEKQIGKLRRLNDNDDTDEDDEQLRLSSNGRKLLENLGQKDLLLNGIDPIQYVKNLSKQQNYGIQQKQLALKYVNTDDVTDSDDSSIDQNTMDLARKLEMNEKTLALNKIHPVKYAKQLTKDDAPLQQQYKKFDQKHVDRKLARQINDDGQTDSDDDSLDDDVMDIAKRLQLNEKQLAFNEINPVKFLKQETKKDAPLQDRYKKFDEKNVDKKLARIINEDNATDSDDSQIDQEIHDLARKLQLNEKQLAFNQINPVKFFKEQTKKDAPLQEQYQKFDEKHIDKKLANRINEQNITDSEDDDSSVDEDAHNLARRLNLNEKQLAFNDINPMKFFKDQTKIDAPLQEMYKKFDEKNVDKKLVRVINDDGDTDSENDDNSEQENDGYRLARELKLNEKQLAANNLNPVKVMQEQAKKDEKLKNIMRQFDEKEMDLKVARMINDNGQTSSEDDDQDEQQIDKIIVARQLKLDEKELAANNINPMKYVKETTKIDPFTNEPKINQAILSTATQTSTKGPEKKHRKKLLDKQLQLRNQMKKQLSENQYTDEDEQEDIRLSKFNKKKLKNMTEKQMMMQGLDPVKAVKKITKQAIAKKMAKKNERNYDDQIPDFKVSPKKSSNPITNVIRSTQQKLKQSTKGLIGNKKDNLKGSHKLPSEQSFAQAHNQNLIDSDSDQENKKLNVNKKMLKSQDYKKAETRIQTVKTGRKQIQEVWDDQFENLKDQKQQQHLAKSHKKHEREMKKPKISLADPNNKIKNFHQQFNDSFMSSEQNSEAALNHARFTNQQDIEGIQLSHQKPKNINLEGNSRKVIDLGVDGEQNISPLKKDKNKRSQSQMNMRTKIVVRQDEMFNEFEEFQDLSKIKQKEFKDKKYQRNLKSKAGSQRKEQQEYNNSKRQYLENDQFEDSEISSVEDKYIQEPKFKRNSKKNTIDNGQLNKKLPNQVTESYVFKDGQKLGSKNKIPSNKIIESQRYSELMNKNALKLPKSYGNQAFEETEFGPRPLHKMSREKSRSKMNSDNESQSGDFANNIRKDRISAKQRLRSAKLMQQKTQSNPASSKRSSVHKKMDRQSRLKMERVNNGNEAQNSDDLEHIQI